ncbi:hypothetical protein M9H77_21090 [Catharanthus roseus]|uniref:Uncharacterized protein n=1 Tax=Catharanthus roseus TaxID=4058 RepID=A0ACC0ALB4_CATRO|nr:hypothetical protein M9H77_21090 [Catharanthus roseus]
MPPVPLLLVGADRPRYSSLRLPLLYNSGWICFSRGSASDEAPAEVLSEEKKKGASSAEEEEEEEEGRGSLDLHKSGIRARKRLQLSGALVDRRHDLSNNSRFQHSKFIESKAVAQALPVYFSVSVILCYSAIFVVIFLRFTYFYCAVFSKQNPGILFV